MVESAIQIAEGSDILIVLFLVQELLSVTVTTYVPVIKPEIFLLVAAYVPGPVHE